jgi:Ras-related protein Rab-11A
MDAVFKLCIFGDGAVGKTTLVNKYVTGVFKGDTTMTIGVDFHVKNLEINGKEVVLQIWDFAGEERFRFLLPTYIRGAAGAIFMYDITRYPTLTNLTKWMEVFNETVESMEKKIPTLMLGGKLDLAEDRCVTIEEAHEIAEKNKFFGYIECSSKTGENVEEIFINATKIMLKKANLL